MANREDWRTELQNYKDQASQALIVEHKRLRELIEQHLTRIEDGHRQFLASKIDAISPLIEKTIESTGSTTSPRSIQSSSTMHIDPVESNPAPAPKRADPLPKGNVAKQAPLAKVQVTNSGPTVEPEQKAKGRMAAFEDWWHDHREPEREGALADFVANAHFTTFCTLIILADQAVTVYTTNLAMRERSNAKPPWVNIAEYMFLAVYCLELVLKIAVHRQYFFFHNANGNGGWNTFDFIIVFYSLLEGLLDSTGVDLSFLRTLRVLKVAKTMKVFRGLGFVDDLRIMIDSLLGCAFKLLWSSLMMVFLLYIFALLFVQTSSAYLIAEGANADPKTEMEMERLFGSVEVALFTLYKMTTGVFGWYDVFLVMRPAGPVSGYVLVFFKTFWMFAVTNIIITVFLNSVIKNTQPSLRDMLKQKMWQNKIDAEELSGLFNDFDADEDHIMTKEELLNCTKEESVMEFLAMRGLDIKDVDSFTNMILEKAATSQPRAGEEKTQLEVLADECFKLRGSASALDVELLGYRLELVLANQHCMMERIMKSGSILDDGNMAQPPPLPLQFQKKKEEAAVDLPYPPEPEPSWQCCGSARSTTATAT